MQCALWLQEKRCSHRRSPAHFSHLGNDEMTDRRRFAAQRLTSLTDREREVATAVGSGASNAEVAASGLDRRLA